jgi:hypothetical protein
MCAKILGAVWIEELKNAPVEWGGGDEKYLGLVLPTIQSLSASNTDWSTSGRNCYHFTISMCEGKL